MEKDQNVEIPDAFLCPISQAIMREPVLTFAFQTYEKKCIEKWFGDGNDTDPMTRQKLTNKALHPNYALKSAIDDFLSKNKEKNAESYGGLKDDFLSKNKEKNAESDGRPQEDDKSTLDEIVKKIKNDYLDKYFNPLNDRQDFKFEDQYEKLKIEFGNLCDLECVISSKRQEYVAKINHLHKKYSKQLD
jgi:hypothetical protein